MVTGQHGCQQTDKVVPVGLYPDVKVRGLNSYLLGRSDFLDMLSILIGCYHIFLNLRIDCHITQ
jgi:hypothetical protein